MSQEALSAGQEPEPAAPLPPADRAREELEKLLCMMGFEAQVELYEQPDGNFLLHIDTEEAAQLIGKHARVLEALQYVLNRILWAAGLKEKFFTVDVARYRERYRDRLLQEAFAAADEVRRSGRTVRLRPMPAADRRVIHRALKDRRDVETVSEETDRPGLKRVVVRPARR